jgi:hypothetical protein
MRTTWPESAVRKAHAEQGGTLRAVLLGPPLSVKIDPLALQFIDHHVEGVRNLLGHVYGTRHEEETRRVQHELQYVMDLPVTDARCVACKRALLLTAMHLEREVAGYFRADEGNGRSLADDLCVRVVPFLLPQYVRDMCQHPEQFVTLATVLVTMWRGERLGSFPPAPPAPTVAAL